MRRGALLVVLLLAAACGGEETRPAPPAAPEPAPPAPEPAAPEPTPPAPPAPAGDLRGDASAGAAVYALYCATCHGPGGRGDGPAAPQDPAPADHTDAAYMGNLSDAHLYKVISEGGAAVGKSLLMAPWGSVLTDAQIRDLVAHLRMLSGT